MGNYKERKQSFLFEKSKDTEAVQKMYYWGSKGVKRALKAIG